MIIINKIQEIFIIIFFILNTFIPNKSLGQLLDISPKNFIPLKHFDSEFSYVEVWFTD